MLKKRFLSVLLCLCMVVGMLPAMTPPAQAATNGHTQDEAVEWARNKIGTSIDYDGAYGAQCVDLIFMYYDYLGQFSRGYARDYIQNALPSGWNRYTNAQTAPERGDIVVFAAGEYGAFWTGHIGIVIESNSQTYSYVDYNGTGSTDSYHAPGTIRTMPLKSFSRIIRPDWPSSSTPAESQAHLANTLSFGDDFYAYITNPNSRCTVVNSNGNVQLGSPNYNDPRQIWHFTRPNGKSDAYTITNMYDGRCLGATADKDEANVTAQPYEGNNFQIWKLYGRGGQAEFYMSPYHYNNNHLRALDVYYAGTSPATNIQLYSNWYRSRGNFSDEKMKSQTFVISKVSESRLSDIFTGDIGSGFYARISSNGSHLQVSGNISNPSNKGMDVRTTRKKSDDPRQIWYFEQQSNGSYSIRNASSDSLYLDVYNGDAVNETNVWTCAGNGTKAQQWYISPFDGGYRIVSALRYPRELFSLDIPHGSTAENANVQIFTQRWGENQRFTIEPVTYTEPSKQVKVQVNATAGGTAKGGGSYVIGETVTVTASAKTGYNFKGWRENGSIVADDSSYTFAVGSNRSLTAVFEKKPTVNYTVRVGADPSKGGTVRGGGTYREGSSVTVTASAKSGYEFAGWTENGRTVSTDSSYAFRADANRSLTAIFEQEQAAVTSYVIRVEANPSEGGTAKGGGTFREGEDVTVTASANSGYTFAGWMENGRPVSNDASYTFEADSDTMLTASFEKEREEEPVLYNVRVVAYPSEGGTVSGGGAYLEDAQVTVSARAHDGYTFVGWLEGGDEVSERESYDFRADADRTLIACFEIKETEPPVQPEEPDQPGDPEQPGQPEEPDEPTRPDPVTTYTVDVSASPSKGGPVTGGGSYPEGANVTVSASENPGYIFQYWMANGSRVSEDKTITFKADRNATLTAVFAEKPAAPGPEPVETYTVRLEASPADGGTVSGSGTYQARESVTISASANPGYTFKGWRQNGVSVGSGTSCIFMATRDVTLTAVFEADASEPETDVTYTIDVSAETGGTASGGGTYESGSPVAVTAEPDDGYRFKAWNENGRSVSTNAVYTFAASDDRALTAVFERVEEEEPATSTYTVSVRADRSNAGTVSGGGSFETNSKATVTAKAGNGYQFSRWTENGDLVSYNRSYTFTVGADRDLVAEFTYTGGSSSSSSSSSSGGFVSGGFISSGFISGGSSSSSGILNLIPTKPDNATPNTNQTGTSGNTSTGTNTAGTGQPGSQPPQAITLVGPNDTATGQPGLQPPKSDSQPPKSGSQSAFPDIAGNEWYSEAVFFVSERGLMTGSDAGVFDAKSTLSRAVLAQILYNAANKPEVSAASSFPDVTGVEWYTTAVSWAASNNIVAGGADGCFAPNDPITREQLAVILWRYSGKPAASQTSLNFNDATAVRSYAQTAMQWAVGKGILTGVNNDLLPGATVTRAQMAQVLMRYMQ